LTDMAQHLLTPFLPATVRELAPGVVDTLAGSGGAMARRNSTDPDGFTFTDPLGQ